ncbi:MAG: thiol reductant ABC exporter subunit CydC [Propionibacteriaceae bacterium]
MIVLWRNLLSDVSASRRRILLAILLAAGASSASVALMAISAWLLSRAAEAPPIMYLNVAIVGVRACGIFRGVLRYVERLVGHGIALRMQGSLRLRIYRSLADTTLLGQRRGDLLTRIVSDVDAVMDLIVRVLLPFASALVVICGTTTILGCFNAPDAVILLLAALFGGIIAPWGAQRLSEKADAGTVDIRGQLAQQTSELHRNAVDLVAYGSWDQRHNALLATDRRLRDAEAQSAWVRGLAAGAQMIATGLAVCAGLWFGGRAVASGAMEPRLVAVLALTPLALHEVLADLAKAAQTWTRSYTALQRVNEVLLTPRVGSGDQQATTVTDGAPKIALANVSLGWPAAEVLVEDLKVQLTSGDRIAITGASGVGKTTLAATILGMIPAKAGTVEVHGQVGYLAQNAYIFSTSLAENVRIGNKDATDEQVLDALQRAGLNLSPQRTVGAHGASLSGGEARRVALARLLIGDFDIWVLDEPTEHLDAETAEALMADIWKAVGTAPCMVITHDPYVVAQCHSEVTIHRKLS